MQDPLVLAGSLDGSPGSVDYRVYCPAKIVTMSDEREGGRAKQFGALLSMDRRWDATGYHLVDTVIIVIVIVTASRNLIAMRRSRRPLSR